MAEGEREWELRRGIGWKGRCGGCGEGWRVWRGGGVEIEKRVKRSSDLVCVIIKCALRPRTSALTDTSLTRQQLKKQLQPYQQGCGVNNLREDLRMGLAGEQNISGHAIKPLYPSQNACMFTKGVSNVWHTSWTIREWFEKSYQERSLRWYIIHINTHTHTPVIREDSQQISREEGTELDTVSRLEEMGHESRFESRSRIRVPYFTGQWVPFSWTCQEKSSNQIVWCS